MKNKCMELHRAYIKRGQFYEARLVYSLLKNKSVKLYLDDASWRVECDLSDLGCPIYYAKNGYYSRAVLREA